MLNNSGEMVELITNDYCEVPKSIVKRWIQEKYDPLAALLRILIDMAKSHNRIFSQSESNVFLCLALVKENRTVEVIAEHLNEDEDWVRETVLGLMYVYFHSSYRAIDAEEIIDFFWMNEKKAKMILWLLEFKGQIPERKHILKWFELNPGKDNDIKITNFIRDEKLYWYCEAGKIPNFSKDNKLEEWDKIYNVCPPGVVSDINKSI